MKNITVNQAITVGKWLVPFAATTLPFLIVAFSFFIWSNNYSIDMLLNACFASILLSWLYWNLASMHWKIWAYSKVRNVHELHRKALELRIIGYTDDNFESKFLITSNQKSQLRALETKFLVNDQYFDDPSFPAEFKLYNSKLVLIVMVCFGLVFIGGAFYGLFTTNDSETLTYCILAIFLFGFLIFATLKNINISTPQLTISNLGITIKDGEVLLWQNIDSEIIEIDFYINSKTVALFHQNHKIQIQIGPLNVNHKRLEKALQTYRVRYENNKK